MDELLSGLSARTPEELLFCEGGLRLTVGQVLDDVRAWRLAHADECGKEVRIGEELAGVALALAFLRLDGWASVVWVGDASKSSCEEVRIGEREAFETDWGCTVWRLKTSGTTGVPKWVSYSMRSLCLAAKRDYRKGVGLIWGLAYDLRRFAGIQVLLQAVLGGSALAIPERVDDLGGVVGFFREVGVNAISATPSWWRLALIGSWLDGVKLRVVTLGGEVADAALLVTLKQQFPGAKVTHVYATTELGVCFSVSDGRAGFPARLVAESTSAGRRLRVAVDGGLEVFDAHGAVWRRSGDLVERQGDRYVFKGREGGQINVGGVKVSPESVERVVLSVAGVGLALARGRANSIVGEVVEVLVVLDGGMAMDEIELEQAIQLACEVKLGRHAVPAWIRVVSELPLSPTGKLVRHVD